MPNQTLVAVLARAFLAGESAADQTLAHASHTLGSTPRWLPRTIRRYFVTFDHRPRPRHRDVVQFLLNDPDFAEHARKLRIAHWLSEPQQMQPVPAAASWNLPPLESIGDLAAWLEITPDELAWFADLKRLTCKNPSARLTHYHYRILTKRSGAIRLIESPKPRLKQVQRQILSQILDRVPAHSAVHGFVRGRSIKTFVAPHTGQRVILRLDLTDFFPTFAVARIQAFFRTAGYPESVADHLGGICTNAARVPGLPFEARLVYGHHHLPQGAPTSPALANLCFHRIDCRLAGLARAAGAIYTRYADDLAFSGDETFARRADRFSTHVAALLSDEGFAVNHHKTRIMGQGVRQRLAGLTANQRVNVIRRDFDRLKAILSNCLRHGPESQNRDAHSNFRAHLEGCVAFMESINPAKARRLRAVFDQIRW
jgi:hypothetical protein